MFSKMIILTYVFVYQILFYNLRVIEFYSVGNVNCLKFYSLSYYMYVVLRYRLNIKMLSFVLILQFKYIHDCFQTLLNRDPKDCQIHWYSFDKTAYWTFVYKSKGILNCDLQLVCMYVLCNTTKHWYMTRYVPAAFTIDL